MSTPLILRLFRISVLLLIILGRIKTSPAKRTYRPSCLHQPTRSPKASVLVSNSPDTPVSSCLPGCSVLAKQDLDPGVVTEFHLLSNVSLFVIPFVDSNLEAPDQGFLYQNSNCWFQIWGTISKFSFRAGSHQTFNTIPRKSMLCSRSS